MTFAELAAEVQSRSLRLSYDRCAVEIVAGRLSTENIAITECQTTQRRRE
ncbi:hypothetical protein ACPF8X_05940 [Streptomyces sp. G35A]